ncbi:hypothetical protein ATK30_4125 [Amycolatopsis echigonensis]|uniref:Uncharacterized protein n=1 Tax=Amycolatopsis echigonensis TaxID=2576905 RepID=A0A2N3WHD4_9PSEU|nr:hypothetical protein ATK30_4125 [Amycolatopsis niigatensis]
MRARQQPETSSAESAGRTYTEADAARRHPGECRLGSKPKPTATSPRQNRHDPPSATCTAARNRQQPARSGTGTALADSPNSSSAAPWNRRGRPAPDWRGLQTLSRMPVPRPLGKQRQRAPPRLTPRAERRPYVNIDRLRPGRAGADPARRYSAERRFHSSRAVGGRPGTTRQPPTEHRLHGNHAISDQPGTTLQQPAKRRLHSNHVVDAQAGSTRHPSAGHTATTSSATRQAQPANNQPNISSAATRNRRRADCAQVVRPATGSSTKRRHDCPTTISRQPSAASSKPWRRNPRMARRGSAASHQAARRPHSHTTPPR